MTFNKKKVLHYGLQRSGTNYLKSVLERSFRVKFLNSNRDRSSPLQKHFRIYDQKKIIPEPSYRNDLMIEDLDDFERLLADIPSGYIIISKSPYSWLISYKEWAQRCNWPEVDHHYIQEWNLFYGKWLELAREKEKIIFVKYIDLLKDLDLELEKITEKLNLGKKIIYPFINKKRRNVSQSNKFTEQREKYYLNKEYLIGYSNKELKNMQDLLNHDVVSELGYEI